VKWFRTEYRHASQTVDDVQSTLGVSARLATVTTTEKAPPAATLGFAAVGAWLLWLLQWVLGLVYKREELKQQQHLQKPKVTTAVSIPEAQPKKAPSEAAKQSAQSAIVELPAPLTSVDTCDSDAAADWFVDVCAGSIDRNLITPGARPVLDHLTLCVVSDTHGFETQCPKLPLADILVHCGDFCNDLKHDAAEARLDEWLAQQPHAQKIVLRGNHGTNYDFFVLLASRAYIYIYIYIYTSTHDAHYNRMYVCVCVYMYMYIYRLQTFT
jgi:hypothetical protein